MVIRINSIQWTWYKRLNFASYSGKNQFVNIIVNLSCKLNKQKIYQLISTKTLLKSSYLKKRRRRKIKWFLAFSDPVSYNRPHSESIVLYKLQCRAGCQGCAVLWSSVVQYSTAHRKVHCCSFQYNTASPSQLPSGSNS